MLPMTWDACSGSVSNVIEQKKEKCKKIEKPCCKWLWENEWPSQKTVKSWYAMLSWLTNECQTLFLKKKKEKLLLCISVSQRCHPSCGVARQPWLLLEWCMHVCSWKVYQIWEVFLILVMEGWWLQLGHGFKALFVMFFWVALLATKMKS